MLQTTTAAIALVSMCAAPSQLLMSAAAPCHLTRQRYVAHELHTCSSAYDVRWQHFMPRALENKSSWCTKLEAGVQLDWLDAEGRPPRTMDAVKLPSL